MAIIGKDSIRIQGLNELRAALKALGPEWPKQLGKANKEVGELIARDARDRAESLGGVAAKSAPSIKSSAAARASTVSIGSDQFPFALGAEFGAKKYPQFKPWRGNQWVESGDENVGYFLHPAIRDDVNKIEELYLDAIDKLAARAFPD